MNSQSETSGYDLNNEYVRNEIVGKRDILDEKENDSNYHSNVQTFQGADVTYIERKQDIPYVAKKSTTTEDARIIHSTPTHGATKTTIFADDGLFSGTQTSTELESMAFSAPGLQQHHNLGQSTFLRKHVQGQDFEQNDNNDCVTNEKYRKDKSNTYDEHVKSSDRGLVQETSLGPDKGTRHGSHRDTNNESNEQSNTMSHSRKESDGINTHVEVIQDFYNKQGAVERNKNRVLEETKQEHTTTNMSTEVPIKHTNHDNHMQHYTYHGILEDEYRTYDAHLSLREQMNIPLGVETSRTSEDDHNGAILKSMLHKNCVEMEMTVQQLGSSIQSRLTSLKELNQYVDTSQLELNKSVTSDSSGVDSSIVSSDSSPRKVDESLDKLRRSSRRKVDDSMSSFSDSSTTRKKSRRRARTLGDSTSSISDASHKKSTRKRSKSVSKHSSRDKLLREVKSQHDTSISSVSDTSSETDSDHSTIPTYAEWAKMQNYGTTQRVLVDKSTSPDHLERPKVEEINYPIPPHLLGHNQYHDPRSLKSAYLLNENLVPERRDSSKDLTANSYLFHQAKESDMLSRYRSAIAAIDKSLLWDDCC
jgi:hypothetical protein